MAPEFWKAVLTPSGLAVGIVLVLVGVLLDHFLARIMKRQDDAAQAQRDGTQREANERENLISDIVDRYLGITGRDDVPGIPNLITAGAGRAPDSKTVIEVAARITQHGKPAPLDWVRADLSDAEILPFITWQAAQRLELRPFYNIPAWKDHVNRFRRETGGQAS